MFAAIERTPSREKSREVALFWGEENSLFEIPVRVSAGAGAVFINLDAARMGEDETDGAEKKEEDHVDGFLNIEKYKSRWLCGRTVEGGFNWKHAVDPKLFNIGIPDMSKSSPLRSWLAKKPTHTMALDLFPNSAIYKIPGADIWYSIVLMPASPTKTNIRWDLYSVAGKPKPAVEKAIESQIEGMISIRAKEFENLPRVVNDENEESQSQILVQLKAHLRVEKALGKLITPTMNKAKTSEKFIQAEILCKELDCLSNNTVKGGSKEQSILAW
ncbi:hypothetical protein UA08_01373 [Talaromyces atroroseus]|uniref:Uncharacterized protein n=1 Tax=Talaromyces atroroseus TaxID=1441469 RepID=A0A1Q5QB66_TALAT|nr:hypothetical protein UA08_01373 [Talaromyces atroroseus]OKL63182.1 hypothetical protein UA08_01373 [Talaromyces atroroseus]